MTDPLKLTPEECEKAIEAIVGERNKIVRLWARGGHYNSYGTLEKIHADLRSLRGLQAEAGANLSQANVDDLQRIRAVQAWVKENV